jgi:beta-lactamase regulating signal transducer with metallopeptidase domain
MDQITRPFHVGVISTPVTLWLPFDRTALVLLGVWLCGFLTIVVLRLRAWKRIRDVVRSSTSMDIAGAGIPVRSYPGLLEPGVVGIWRPVLLLPADIQTRLTPSQLDAVLAHELSHIRRRDNLTSAVHMIVEAVFWFHPLVWWIGVRMVDEREHACDEEVLRLGNDPEDYAEGILNVCKIYLESPLRCVSGVTGANLKKRIHSIVTGSVAANLSFARRTLLAAAVVIALLVPLIVGVIVSASPGTQAPVETPSQIDARDSMNKGVQAFKAQRYDSAIDYFKKAAELDPNLTSAELYLATAYAQRYTPGSSLPENQRYADLAIQSYQSYLDKTPTDKNAWAGLAVIYQNSAQFDKARDAYLRNAQADPENPVPRFAVGAVDWILVHNGVSTLSVGERTALISEGLQYLDKALAINPDYEDAMWYENLLLREQSGILKMKAQQTQDTNEARSLIADAAELENRADDWSNRALEARRKAQRLGAAATGR